MPPNAPISAPPSTAAKPNPPTTHDLHVKGVPLDVWRHARHNALLSNLSFKAYIIRTLAGSRPFTIDQPPARSAPGGQ